MITGVEGVSVGHWSHPEARTGCSVAILPPGSIVSGEVRGGAPATREFALLEPGCLVETVDAVVLTGGSAFGLASADGVMGWLESQGRGFPTAAGRVPIVVAMGLFDLAVGDSSVRPDAAAGRVACETALAGPVPMGRIGAGTGATVGKWGGGSTIRPGGLCGAVLRYGELVVASLIAVNAVGSIDPGSSPETGVDDLEGVGWLAPPGSPEQEITSDVLGNTTIGLVVTNARLTKLECHLVAQSCHDGLARSILPAHTRFDGDAMVAAATGSVAARLDAVRAMATTVVTEAVRSLA